jgi:putative flippase GtrA
MLRALIELFFKYTAAGSIATAVHYAIFLALIDFSFWIPWKATLLASSVGAVVAYVLNYHFTFYSTAIHRIILPKFLLVAALGVLIQTLIVAMLNQHWHLHYLLAQLIATCIGLIVTFLINDFWTFA